MGTRRKTRKKTGGTLWTPNQQQTVKRRQNLLSFASNSTQKSNVARQAVHQYLTNAEQEEKMENMIITFDMVVQAITPRHTPVSLTDYVDFSQRKCEDLVETTIHQLMRQKKKINMERRRSKQATFLANRAAERAKQAARIASIGRLLNSSRDNAIQQELNAWNRSALQRGLDQQREIEEAERIFQNKTTIQLEEVRLRYELTKQIVQQLEKLDALVVLHYVIQDKALGPLSVYYKTKEDDEKTLVTRARDMIVKQIPELKGMVAVDRAIPSVTEHIMAHLVKASEAYMKIVKGSELELAKARLEHTRIQEKQMRYANLHFEILTRSDYRLRQELAKNPYLDIPKHKALIEKLKKNVEEVKRLEK